MNMRQALIVMLLVLVIVPSVALAVGFPSGPIVPCKGPDCSVCSIATLAQNILNIAIFLATFLTAILFAWAGFKYLTAGGNPGEITAAKHLFVNVAVGLIIILAAWLIVNTLIGTLSNLGNWSSLCSG